MCVHNTHPPPSEFFTLSLHDALPILAFSATLAAASLSSAIESWLAVSESTWISKTSSVVLSALKDFSAKILSDRKSTRLNSSHRCISYAVFCLKKKQPTTPIVVLYYF